MFERFKILFAVSVFVIGVIVGSLLPTRSVRAQESKEPEGQWVFQTAQKGLSDGYLYNARTGEMFQIQEHYKFPVTLKPK